MPEHSARLDAPPSNAQIEATRRVIARIRQFHFSHPPNDEAAQTTSVREYRDLLRELGHEECALIPEEATNRLADISRTITGLSSAFQASEKIDAVLALVEQQLESVNTKSPLLELQTLERLRPIFRARRLYSVLDHLDRLFLSLDDDPSSVPAAANSLLESLCRSYLEHQGCSIRPDTPTVDLWWTISRRQQPGTDDTEPAVFGKTLSGLSMVVDGLASRAHEPPGSDGAAKHSNPLILREARLAAQATQVLAWFLVETWEDEELAKSGLRRQKRVPRDPPSQRLAPKGEIPTEIRIKRNLDRLVMSVTGCLDEHRAPDLEERLIQTLSDEQCVVIDLSGVPAIDGAGLSALVRLFMLLRLRGLRLVLCGATDSVRESLAKGDLEKILPICSDCNEVLAVDSPRFPKKWREKEGEEVVEYEVEREPTLHFDPEIWSSGRYGDWQSWTASAFTLWMEGGTVSHPAFAAFAAGKMMADEFAALLRAMSVEQRDVLKRHIVVPPDPYDYEAAAARRYRRALAQGDYWAAGAEGRLVAELRGEGPRSFRS